MRQPAKPRKTQWTMVLVGGLFIVLLLVRLAFFVFHGHRAYKENPRHNTVAQTTYQWTDSYDDGTPDFMRLTDPRDQEAFRGWFTSIAELEASKPTAVVRDAILDKLAPFRKLAHTLTTDNGKEFALHEEIAAKLKLDFYFCHLPAAWERGANENLNGLLRQFFFKASQTGRGERCGDRLGRRQAQPQAKKMPRFQNSPPSLHATVKIKSRRCTSYLNPPIVQLPNFIVHYCKAHFLQGGRMLPDDPKERINWVRPADFAGWEYLLAHSSRHLWTVYHETYAICASYHYGQTWAYRGRRHTMTSSGLMLIEPGETHRTLSNPSCVQFKVAMIPHEDVAMAIGELGLPANLHLRTALATDEELNRAVWKLGEIAESGAASLLEIESRQAEIVRRLLGYAERAPSYADDSTDTRAVGRAVDLLRASLNRQVTMNELVAACGLSRYRLVRAFTRAVGVPPHAYHLQLRIAEARRLLQKGITGREIAADLGFADQPHFIRHFRKILRVSPGQYASGYEDALSIGIPSGLPRTIEMGWHDEHMLNEGEQLVVDLVRPYIAQAWRDARLNERLNRQLRMMEECIEQLHAGVIECNARGQVQFINSQARQYLAGYFGQIRQANGLLPDDLLRWVRAQVLLSGGSDDAPPVRSPLVIDKGSTRLLLRLLSQPGEHLILMEEQTVNSAGKGSTSMGLTARESEVLDWIARGKTNREIAVILAMQTATVKKHVEHILQKLGVETRTAAAVGALESQKTDGIPDTQR